MDLELVVDGRDVELLALLADPHPRLLRELDVVDAPARDAQVLGGVGDPEARHRSPSAADRSGLAAAAPTRSERGDCSGGRNRNLCGDW